MTEADGEIRLHIDSSILRAQLDHAQVGLQMVTDQLWQAIQYNRDPIAEALDIFPSAQTRRADTIPFNTSAEEELALRETAAKLGPGREDAETLQDLGIGNVDAEIIETGQLHKTVTELEMALRSGQTAPIILVASDRKIPMWKKNEEKQEDEMLGFDDERVSTTRLLQIGGHDLDRGRFFLRAGAFDAQPDVAQAKIAEHASECPGTEYAATKQFVLDMLQHDDRGVVLNEDVPVGYDLEEGLVTQSSAEQVRLLGKIDGREIYLLHKQKRLDGKAFDTAQTMLIASDIAAQLVGKESVSLSYYTSSTYKPSRYLEGITASLMAGKRGKRHTIAVPTYGYQNLAAVQGKDPQAQNIPHIAGELNNTAKAAAKLRELIASYL